MTRLAYRLVLAAATLLAAAPPAPAAVDLFLQIDGIKGEATEENHKDWIDLLSFAWGVSNSGSVVLGGGAGAGKSDFQDFSFTKVVDASSPPLFQHAANGKHIDEAVLELVKAGPEPSPFLRYTFTEVLVTSFSQSGSGGGDLPVDSFSFAYGKLREDYRFIDPRTGQAGPWITASWDLTEGNPPPVPEPSTWAMLAAGLAFLAWRGGRTVGLRRAVGDAAI